MKISCPIIALTFSTIEQSDRFSIRVQELFDRYSSFQNEDAIDAILQAELSEDNPGSNTTWLIHHELRNRKKAERLKNAIALTLQEWGLNPEIELSMFDDVPDVSPSGLIGSH